jgi:hypothetical protein
VTFAIGYRLDGAPPGETGLVHGFVDPADAQWFIYCKFLLPAARLEDSGSVERAFSDSASITNYAKSKREAATADNAPREALVEYLGIMMALSHADKSEIENNDSAGGYL